MLAAYPAGVDTLIDLVAYTAGTLPLAAVAPGGRVASTFGAADELTPAEWGLLAREIVADTSRALIGRLAAQVAADSLSVDVTVVLSLDQATDGLRTIARGDAPRQDRRLPRRVAGRLRCCARAVRHRARRPPARGAGG